jgi:hypothetical protein
LQEGVLVVAEYCTILGSKDAFNEVLDRLRQVSSAPVGVIEDAGRWHKLVLKGKRSMLTLNSIERDKPGDEFSDVQLGLHDLFWNVETDAEEKKKTVLNAISACVLAIGVVAEPALDESEGHFACILDVAKIVKGVIFNGSAILDSDGRLLLDQEGRFEE